MALQNRSRRPGALLALVATAFLAGCLGFGDDEANSAPTADLRADQSSGWVTETFRFDASRSTDRDGDIVRWTFDFGDGNNTTVEDADRANVTHMYGDGGEYTVTVTVVDDGRDDGLEQKSDTAQMLVAVNDNETVAAQVVDAPLSNDTSVAAYDAGVNEGADLMRLELDVQGSLLVGSSEVTIRVLDPDGEALVDETVTVDGTDNQTVEMETPVDEAGNYTLEFEANSGGATISGEVLTYYDETA